MKPIANNIMPFSPTHPGEVLNDEIEFLKISKLELALQMGVSYTALNEVLDLKRSVDAEFALRVEASLGLEAEMLLNMQARYNLQVTRENQL